MMTYTKVNIHRIDVGLDIFPEVTVQSCLSSDYAIYQNTTKYPLIKDEVVVVVVVDE